MTIDDLEALFGGKKSSPSKQEIDRFKNFPTKLEFAIEGISGSKIKWKPNPKQFSIREIICHLVDMESLTLANMNAIIASEENKPAKLLRFDTVNLASRFEYNEQDELLAIQSLKYFRQHMSEILKILPETIFDKQGLWENDKKIALLEVLSTHNQQADKYLKDIELIKEEFTGQD